jgi:hypothetical protein
MVPKEQSNAVETRLNSWHGDTDSRRLKVTFAHASIQLHHARAGDPTYGAVAIADQALNSDSIVANSSELDDVTEYTYFARIGDFGYETLVVEDKHALSVVG